ncbi:hypothetical protein Cgig2_007544 [Carnegiea gigantea]|uniref:Uncharacterized protein n=1 Tax=Carnegiea gigantea TaxID=171969 RepID=A0A9Q1K5G1_9CARY|nr:hypothetical protein Cgig2_007544 [Carnegiea gigantea]
MAERCDVMHPEYATELKIFSLNLEPNPNKFCIGDRNETVSHTEAKPQNTDDQGTQYGEDTVFELFYLDRVEFRVDKVERWFPIAINWPTESITYTYKFESIQDNDITLKNNKNEKVTIVAQAQEGKMTTQIHIQSSRPPTSDITCVNQNETDCISPDDIYYCSPEFLQ